MPWSFWLEIVFGRLICSLDLSLFKKQNKKKGLKSHKELKEIRMMYILLCDKMIRHQHNKNQKIDLFLS